MEWLATGVKLPHLDAEDTPFTQRNGLDHGADRATERVGAKGGDVGGGFVGIVDSADGAAAKEVFVAFAETDENDPPPRPGSLERAQIVSYSEAPTPDFASSRGCSSVALSSAMA